MTLPFKTPNPRELGLRGSIPRTNYSIDQTTQIDRPEYADVMA
jgi:hypothetical protein